MPDALTQPFVDRREAGAILAQQLRHYANRSDALVLALPRGGVPVGYEVATVLGLPLDVFVVRTIGVPGQPELAMGAIPARFNSVGQWYLNFPETSDAEVDELLNRARQALAAMQP